ncbi:MAG: hypothetical protein AB4042_16010 [Leptolyngbyaceae cyanobacterium]
MTLIDVHPPNLSVWREIPDASVHAQILKQAQISLDRTPPQAISFTSTLRHTADGSEHSLLCDYTDW